MSQNNRYRFFQDQISGQKNQIYDYAPIIGSRGDLTRISGIDVAINSIRTFLLTPRGHYPFDPEYGSDLYKKLFEPNDTITMNEIEYEIKIRIQQYENRVKVTRVRIHLDGTGKSAQVDVDIDRNGITGKVSAILNSQRTMFGLEDSITAAWNQ